MKQFLEDIEPFFYRRSVVYVDVGAYKGETFEDVLASGISLTEAHLFEPNPESFPLLEKMVRRHKNDRNIERVALHKAAVGNGDAPVRFLANGSMTKVLEGNKDDDAAVLGSEKAFEAPCISLDAAARHFLEKHISILKIDVEGYELNVIEGAGALLKEQKIDFIYCEAGINPESTQQTYYRKIEDMLSRHGYRLFKIYEQHHEWIVDSPLLRRVNLAFISSRFAESNPMRLSKEVFTAHVTIEALKTDIEARNSKIQELQTASAAGEKENSHLQDKLKAAEAMLAELEGMKSASARLEETLRTAERRAAERIAALESAAAARKGKLEEQKAVIGWLNRELTTIRREAEEAKTDLARRQAELNDGKQKIDAEKRRADEAKTELARVRGEKSRLWQQHKDTKTEFAAHIAQLRDLRTSTSWRITAPLRMVKKNPVAVLKNPVTVLKRRRRASAAYKAIAASPLFDAHWYLAKYPDVAAAGADPIMHYILSGAAEGRDPGPEFSTSFYIEEYPDVGEAGMNPLYHYIAYGQDEERETQGANGDELLLSKALQKKHLSHANSDVLKTEYFHNEEKIGQKEISVLRLMPDENPLQLEERIERRQAEKSIQQLRRRMLNLGFVEKAKAEFLERVKDKTRPYRGKLAAWELATWHLNQESGDDIERSLRYLQEIIDFNPDSTERRRVSIMRAEAHARLGNRAEAKQVLITQQKEENHVDILFGLANLEQDHGEKIKLINKAFNLFDMEGVFLGKGENKSLYDQLSGSGNTSVSDRVQPLVSIIMPTYNAQDFIETAIESVRNQTWVNFELLVVDDCSKDNTIDIVNNYCATDSRIRLLSTDQNGGPYIARNVGLQVAQGEFVTCHDADDWSHPSKIELQATRLKENKLVLANMSQQARATENLLFHRRGNPGFYCFPNISSLMFRRVEMLKKFGFWDSVRFGADGELIRRIRRIHGERSVEQIDGGPVSFQRQTASSLTGNSVFGYSGFFMGARQEYFDCFVHYHKNNKKLKYQFPQNKRPFSVPAPLRPSSQSSKKPRHFDVVIASDFRLAGGSTLSSIEEIKAQSKAGIRTGIIQLNRYDFDPGRRMNPKVRDLTELDNVESIVFGEEINCDLLIIRYPPVLQEKQVFIPNVRAADIRLIVNQPPMSDYGPDSVLRYDIPRCSDNLREYFGKDAVWHPIGPAIRDALHQHHENDLSAIILSPDDWVNIAEGSALRRASRPAPGVRPRIGRHARDHEMKWPSNRETLLNIYPDSDKYEVYVMGGATVPEQILGGIPANWKVVPFDGLPVKDYLAGLDVFIYFTNPDWVESFGRVIIEAMAAGVPVIVPPIYRPLFEEAALYAEPREVLSVVDELMADPAYYDERVRQAIAYVDRRFGHEMHIERIGMIVNKSLSRNSVQTNAAE